MAARNVSLLTAEYLTADFKYIVSITFKSRHKSITRTTDLISGEQLSTGIKQFIAKLPSDYEPSSYRFWFSNFKHYSQIWEEIKSESGDWVYRLERLEKRMPYLHKHFSRVGMRSSNEAPTTINSKELNQ